MEAEVKANYPKADIKLIEGGGGIFDVKYNDKLIYSKQKIEGQRFPREGEITKLIKQANRPMAEFIVIRRKHGK